MARLTIKHHAMPAMVVSRSRLWTRKMVYVLLANKPIRYANGNYSRVIYIGCTRKGAERPAKMAASKSTDAFKTIPGVTAVEVHIVTCKKRPNVRSWELLESAMLVTFKFIYGQLPQFNRKRGEFRHIDEIDKYFREKRIRKILKSFEPW